MNKDEILQEFKEMMQGNKVLPSEFFNKYKNNQTAKEFFKELYNLDNVIQDKIWHSEGNAYEHTMMVMDNAQTEKTKVNNSYGFMLSAMCHDFGKAVTTYVDENTGKIKATGHAKAGVPLAEDFLRRINESEHIKYVSFMVENHMMPNDYFRDHKNKNLEESVIYDLYDKSYEYGSCPKDLYYLAKCDELGKGKGLTEENKIMTSKLYDMFYEYNNRQEEYER